MSDNNSAQNTLEQLKENVLKNDSLSGDNKAELLKLLSSLSEQLTELSKSKSEHAGNIAEHIERSTNEALKVDKDPSLLKKALEGLSDSVKGFEVTHPVLVEDVNYWATVLANMGL